MPPSGPRKRRRRWRDYRTAAGRRPVKEALDQLGDADLASVAAAMREVREQGLRTARHLEGDIYEVRADGVGVIYRILFAPQGLDKQVFSPLRPSRRRPNGPRRRRSGSRVGA